MAAKPKEKITVSVDAELLSMVDSYVEVSRHSGVSRSAVFEQSLRLWRQSLRDQFDERYYLQNQEALTQSAWTALSSEAAQHVWKISQSS